MKLKFAILALSLFWSVEVEAATPAQCFENPSLCQKSSPAKVNKPASKKKTSSSKPKTLDVIGREFKKFSSEGRTQIQKALSDMGLYNSSLDGLYGKGTRNSIAAYLDNKGIEELSGAEVSAALKELLVPKKETEQLALTTDKSDDLEHKLEAQNFISDLEEYVSSGKSQFDLNFAIEFAKISDIKKGKWNGSLKQALNQFKLYVASEQGFVNFHEIKTAERQKAYQDKLTKTKEELFELVSLMRTWAKANLLDERTAEVIKLVVSAEEVLQDDNLSLVEETLASVVKMNSVIGISKPVSADVDRDSPFVPDTLYVFGNFTGNAKHIFKGLSGKPEIAEGEIDICIIGEWDKWQRYAVLDYVSEELNPSTYSISKQACLGKEDLLAITGKRLIEGQLPPSFKTGYEKLNEIERSDAIAIKRKFSLMSEIYEEDVLVGGKSGYGVLTFNNSVDTTCLSVPKNSADHIDALRGNYDLRTLFESSLEDVQISENVIDAFRKIQRGKCGFIYAKSMDLAKLIDAAKNNNLSYTLLPVWITEETVAEIAESRTATAKARLSEQEAREQQQRLTEEAREALLQKALVKQASLRDKYQVRYAAILDQLMVMTKTAIDFGFKHSPLDSNYMSKYLELDILDPITEKSSSFDPIIEDIQDLALEKWEQSGSIMEKIDYGTVNFKGRTLEGVIAEIKVSMKNRVIGDFKTYCRKIRAIQDDDFDMWRKVEISSCGSNDNEWSLLNEFESRWVVNTEE